nr:hypothetical protein BaRGS_020283 [Batillaria attramentaria]
MAVANTTLSPYLLAAMHEHCLGRHGNISPTFSPPLDSTEAVGKEGEEEDTDFGAVMYITAVLVFYSLGIVVMIIKYLKTERKEMEEEVNLENFFKGIPSKRIEHEREAVNRVAIRAFHTLTSRAAPPQTIQPGARDNPIADMDDECDLSPDRNESDGDGSDGGDNSPNLLHRERSKYLPRVSLMFRDNRPPYERRKMNESVKSQGGRLPREDRSLDAITPGQQSPNTAPLAEQERDGEAPVPGARHADSVPQLKNPGPASCSIVSEEQFRPRRNASHNSLRKLRNGDAPRSSVVSFSDGIQPGLRKKRPENGSPKAHLDSPRTVQKSALKRSSPSRDSPI